MNAKNLTVKVAKAFSASPAQVYAAWTDKTLARQWLFTSPESEGSHYDLNVEAGGRWTISDRRGGTDYTATGVYEVVEPGRRLVFTFAMPQFSPNSDRITVLFQSEGDGCLMTLIQEGEDIARELEQLGEGEPGGAEQGWQAMFASLTGVLVRSRGHGELSAPDTLHFERLLPGPVERVWEFLVNSDKRGQWLASGELPATVGEGFTIRFDHASLSPHRVPTPERFKPYEGGIDSHHILTQYDPPHRLGISWGGGRDASGNEENKSEVVFELKEEGNKVRLTLTHRCLVDSDLQVSTAGGWHTHLAILEAKLKGITPPSFWTLFDGIEEEYQLRVGGAV